MEFGRKRGLPDSVIGNGGSKRAREMDLVGSKSKPCTKFFSISGCPYGIGCHFQHYVPGGYNAVAQMTNMGPTLTSPPSRGPMGPPPPIHESHSSPAGVKTKICNRFTSPEGCKFGDQCYFAHGEKELGKLIPSSRDTGPMAGPTHTGPSERMGDLGFGHGYIDPTPPPSTFGASATTKISVDASLAGAIIGKGGVNTKHICRVTGAKLAIRENEADPKSKSIELEGTFDQINKASAMVKDLIMTISSSTSSPMPMKAAPPATGGHHPSANNYKTKACERFAKGVCTFGDRCNFAHGASELRKAAS